MINALKKVLKWLSDGMADVYMDNISLRVIPDDVPYREIKAYQHNCYACEMFFACVHTVRLTEDGPELNVFWDQNYKMCVEDVDGTIYRVKM